MSQVVETSYKKVQRFIENLILREGGYVDHPNDPGGATNMGITMRALRGYRKRVVYKSELINLKKEVATSIYYQNYWCKLRLHNFTDNWWLQEFMFDWCVNAGLKTPVKRIQKIIGVKQDGDIGPITSASMQLWMLGQGVNGPSLLVDDRIRFYIELLEKNKNLSAFIEGWFNRASEFRYNGAPFSNL